MFNFEKYVEENKNNYAFEFEENKLEFAYQLDNFLMQNGMSKKDLADKVGVSRPYITKVLQGDANLTLESLTKFCNAVDSKFHFKIIARGKTGKWLEHTKIIANEPKRSGAKNTSAWNAITYRKGLKYGIAA